MATLSADEQKKTDDLISNLETAVGQLNTHDVTLRGLVKKMIQDLNALRSVLGVVRPH